ncbi:MAG TPA: DUF5808 domain-containing protein [Pseudogracilibacillus sp.]|nr:DUF5808 domain-containing protein [Pseudogracilibacillus sp.]
MNLAFEHLIVYMTLLPLFLLSFTPYLTKKTDCFGVTIPLDMYDRPEFRKMRKQFTFISFLINLLILFGLLFLQARVSESTFMISFIVLIFSLLIIFFILYLPFHQSVKKMKKNEAWIYNYKQKRLIDTEFRKANLAISYKWYLIPFLMIVGTLLYSFIIYDTIPSEIPTHTGPGGHVTYSEKSMTTIILLPIIQLFMLAIFVASQYAITIAKQSLHPANPKGSQEQNKKFRRYWSIFTLLIGIATTALLSYIQLAMFHDFLFQEQSKVILLFITIVIVSLIILSIRTGQSGSRLNELNSETDHVIEVDEDEHWILGQIYFNRQDPTIFVEKRFGIGWTVNFARPITWIFLLILLLPLALLIVI